MHSSSSMTSWQDAPVVLCVCVCECDHANSSSAQREVRGRVYPSCCMTASVTSHWERIEHQQVPGIRRTVLGLLKKMHILCLTAVFIVKLVRPEASPVCYCQSDTCTFLYNSSNCEDLSLKINGITQAHGQDFNETLIRNVTRDSGRYNVNLMTCQTNVTFSCDKNLFNCGDSCPEPYSITPKPPKNQPRWHTITVIMFVITSVIVCTLCCIVNY
ncbi:uncharacterized protein [Hoplias malabaricus]|uniref:uncharacterized protein n=1 Tax=Hoplias malabaricus TaxID=27720 RepID=UPI003462E03F